jgi:hydroxymethylbilane synthase
MNSKNNITVGARASSLSKIQVEEVLEALSSFHPEISFSPTFVHTHGDRDLKTSLRTLPRGNFFTKELDIGVLSGQYRVAIHSAKDLPIPLPCGLELVALTKGKDSRDALVLRKGDTLESLPPQAKIATSSLRRIEAIKELRGDLSFSDIRGTIEKRLQRLDEGTISGLVVAMCAMERLHLENKYSLFPLEQAAARYQGRLAVIAREGDIEMEKLFSSIDSKKVLYTGLEAPKGENIIHVPLIETVPLSSHPSLTLIKGASHLLFGSKTAIGYFFEALESLGIEKKDILKKPCFSIGKKTSISLMEAGFKEIKTATSETSRGLCELLSKESSIKSLLWPHSELASNVLPSFFQSRKIPYIDWPLYTTKTKDTSPFSLVEVDEIFFSSPSGVSAFIKIFKTLPEDILMATQGAVTYDFLKTKIPCLQNENKGSNSLD